MQKMTIGVTGNIAVEITGETPQEIIKQAAFWNGLPTECATCKSSLIFFHKTPKKDGKTVNYYGLRCTGPEPHCINFGITTDSNTMFYDPRKGWQRFGVADYGDSDSTGGQDRGPYTREHPSISRPAAAPHPNAPGSDRGSYIEDIKRLALRCSELGINHGVTLESLGGFQGGQLKNIVVMLQNKIANATREA